MRKTIGIDVSKDTLDAYRLSDGEHIQVRNDKLGHRVLIRWLGKDHGPLVVFEATGAYHRQMETALAARAIPFVKVNPRQARRFAEATGRLAKTDRVDAVMLAKMGAVLELEAQQPKSENLHELKELMAARRALIKDQTAARARLATATQSLIKRQINARLLQITEQVQQIDAAMTNKVAHDEAIPGWQPCGQRALPPPIPRRRPMASSTSNVSAGGSRPSSWRSRICRARPGVSPAGG